MVSKEMNQLAVAEDYYKKSLALAQQSEDKDDLVDAMTALAAISVDQQKWDQAIRYSQEAIGLLSLPRRPNGRARRTAC